MAKVGLAKVGLAKVGLAKVGRITMAKVCLAKVGFDRCLSRVQSHAIGLQIVSWFSASVAILDQFILAQAISVQTCLCLCGAGGSWSDGDGPKWKFPMAGCK